MGVSAEDRPIETLTVVHLEDNTIESYLTMKKRLHIFSVVATLLMSVSLGADDQPRTRVAQAVRVKTAPVIDGDLSDAVWQQTPIATGFFRIKEGSIHPARLKTEVRILYDEEALYIGIYCEEPDMGNLRETMTRRDSRIWHNDCVEVMLDTYRDRRNCYVFATNTLGTQMDERIGNESVFDMSWDAVWESKVRKYRHGWTAEFSIPFRVLRFDPHNATWGINFWRTHPISGQSYSWAPSAFFGRVSEFGDLTGLNLGKIGIEPKIGILPYATYRTIDDGQDDFDGGLDFIVPVSTHLTSNVTFNPDFSQLESDPTRINIVSDRELSLPERRPFFREGAELFKLPLNLYYTRRVQEIDIGTKVAGRLRAANFAVINTYGKMIDRYDGDRKKQANLLAGRVNYDIGERTVVGFMGVRKHQEDRDVLLLSLNGRIGFGRDLTATSQFAVNSIGGQTHSAYHQALTWVHEGWMAQIGVEEIQDGFRPNEIGLEDDAFHRKRVRARYSYGLPENSLVRSLTAEMYHAYQTDADKLLRERRNEFRFNVEIGRIDFATFGGFGALREVGELFDTRFLGSEMNYTAQRWHLSTFGRIGLRRGEISRYSSFSAGLNLLEKTTVDVDLGYLSWDAIRNTIVFRLRGNYQLTRRVGWRIYIERIEERLRDENSLSFNAIFDYEFTPESHFYFVFVDGRPGNRAAFAKVAYLFESGVPDFGKAIE